MRIHDFMTTIDAAEAAQWMCGRIRDWYPICRSITGEGLRETLRRIADHAPLTLYEVPSGTPVFDWRVPQEWNIRDAYVKDAAGRRVVDFRAHNLHVLGYSVPVKKTASLAELKEHCFTLPEHPEWIPYRNSYYAENWGFCLTQHQLDTLEDGEYEVCIDATLADGSLTYGECFLPGETEEEILFSAHACHPSLANDNLSGLALATYLAKVLGKVERRYSYRFIFAPGTIGAITWLARNEERAGKIRHGLILACLGDPGATTYKKSRRGNAEIDLAAQYVLERSGPPFAVLDFSPYGYDERQYCSPGFNLPVGCFMRTPPGGYPEYHSSADNLDLVRPECLADSLAKILGVLEVLEGNATYRNLNPKCEPQLGKRGLYGAIGGRTDAKALEMSMLWVLNYSDGEHSLLDIARMAPYSFHYIRAAADALLNAGLLAEIE